MIGGDLFIRWASKTSGFLRWLKPTTGSSSRTPLLVAASTFSIKNKYWNSAPIVHPLLRGSASGGSVTDRRRLVVAVDNPIDDVSRVRGILLGLVRWEVRKAWHAYRTSIGTRASTRITAGLQAKGRMSRDGSKASSFSNTKSHSGAVDRWFSGVVYSTAGGCCRVSRSRENRCRPGDGNVRVRAHSTETQTEWPIANLADYAKLVSLAN